MSKKNIKRTSDIDMSTMSPKELGRIGGLKTLKTKGPKHFVKAAKARWDKYRANKNT